MANSFSGPWSGSPACENCFNLHRAAGDNAVAVLDAYAKATEALRSELDDYREILEGSCTRGSGRSILTDPGAAISDPKLDTQAA